MNCARTSKAKTKQDCECVYVQKYVIVDRNVEKLFCCVPGPLQQVILVAAACNVIYFTMRVSLQVVHCGPSGAGHAVKAVNNALNAAWH
jgi:hypothetical protein